MNFGVKLVLNLLVAHIDELAYPKESGVHHKYGSHFLLRMAAVK